MLVLQRTVAESGLDVVEPTPPASDRHRAPHPVPRPVARTRRRLTETLLTALARADAARGD